MNPRGWFEDRGKAAADALIKRSQKGLAVLVARVCASFPWECVLTYEKLASAVAEHFGRKPHRESVGRVVRQLARRGLLTSRRVMPGERVAGLKYPSCHGTTAKDFPFRRLGERDPVPKHRRARVRHQLRGRYPTSIASIPAAAASQFVGPKYSSHIEQSTSRSQFSRETSRNSKPTNIDPLLARMFAEGDAYFDAREATEDAQMYESVKRDRAPP